MLDSPTLSEDYLVAKTTKITRRLVSELDSSYAIRKYSNLLAMLWVSLRSETELSFYKNGKIFDWDQFEKDMRESTTVKKYLEKASY